MTVAANKKITILIKRLNHGGAEKVCVTLCNELAKRNYNVELWILDFKDNVLTRQLNKNVKVTNLKKKHVRNSIIPLVELCITKKPKQILVFNIELAILTIAIKKIFFLKTGIIVRSINTLSQAYKASAKQWNRFLTYKMIKFFLPLSNRIIAQSRGMKEDLINRFNIQSHKIVTIHNPAFNISIKNLHNNHRQVIENEFLYVGRLQPQKGLENLIQIFNMTYTKNQNIHLTIAGEGPEEYKLKTLSENLGLTSAITFLGYQSDTIHLYKKAKATLLTSLYEGFPNVLVESIAVGTPVIAFDCPSGPKDIIEQGVNGILVPNMDFESFSSTLLAVANSEIEFNKSEVIKSSNKFSTNSIINKYEELFNDIDL